MALRVPLVVLPCLDEAAALPTVLAGLPVGWTALVVDNGSTDGSADVARRYGALVVRAETRGFGAACHAGVQEAVRLLPPDDLLAFCDADATLRLDDLPRLAAPVLAGEADLVLGRRRTRGLRAWPPHARLGNAVLAAALRRRTGAPLRDLGPLRVARVAPYAALPLRDRRFGYPLEAVLRATEAGWRLREVDVDYLPRVGRSKVTGTALGTARAVRDMRRVLADL